MTEDDLKQATEIYQKRRLVQTSLDNLIAAETLSLERACLSLFFPVANAKFPSKATHANLDADAAREICALARKHLEDRLRDIDASLRAFGCEPPKQAPAVAPVRQRETRK
jgi:hypothetical protein